jgi:spore maturation protein CgeB
MRILCVQPGASWSTNDVYVGIVNALGRQNVEVIKYALDGRIQSWGGYLTWLWKRNKKQGPKPAETDIIYMAGIGLLERALRFAADWVLIVSCMYLHPDVVLMLRRAGLKVAILFTESPYDDVWQKRIAPLANVCWVNDKVSVQPFRAVNRQTYYWQHAYDPARHHPQATEAEDAAAHDVVFVGTGFEERVKLLEEVNWDGIDLGLYGSWDLLGPNHHLRKHLRGGITPNEQTAALYQRAKIGINLHRSSKGFGRGTEKVAEAYSLGPRCYELAACGAFYVSDYRPELADVFGDVVPTYASAAELETQIRYYLAHDEERAAKAAQLPGLVARHTFDARVTDMLAILERQGE